jgi:hypothetical protein
MDEEKSNLHLVGVCLNQIGTGQTKPSGPRRLNRNAAQLASSGNSFWNSVTDLPRATGYPLEPRCRLALQGGTRPLRNINDLAETEMPHWALQLRLLKAF